MTSILIYTLIIILKNISVTKGLNWRELFVYLTRLFIVTLTHSYLTLPQWQEGQKYNWLYTYLFVLIHYCYNPPYNNMSIITVNKHAGRQQWRPPCQNWASVDANVLAMCIIYTQCTSSVTANKKLCLC